MKARNVRYRVGFMRVRVTHGLQIEGKSPDTELVRYIAAGSTNKFDGQPQGAREIARRNRRMKP